MTALAELTPYDRIGGEEAIRALVQRFYTLMDELPEARALRQLHPPSLKGTEELLFEYLSGWFGGPPLYTTKKGHPRLRMRHAPFAVSSAMRDQWMLCMTKALGEQIADVAFRGLLINTFSQMANHLINSEDNKHGAS